MTILNPNPLLGTYNTIREKRFRALGDFVIFLQTPAALGDFVIFCRIPSQAATFCHNL